LVVVNCTFFSFATNQNLNVVIKDGKMVGFNIHTIAGHGKDTLTYRHPTGSAIGISKSRKVDIAWLFADTLVKYPIAFERNPELLKDSFSRASKFSFAPELLHLPKREKRRGIKDRWKMITAVGGGPVLMQNGEIRITNNEELKFAGKAINDKHPRTAMGYTKDGKLIILMIEGRNTVAHGAALGQEAQILKDLGCWEALNLDGGGSSCMLVNGKETIKTSDKEGQRAVPAVFIIKKK
jgi:exopolysaccharide biosynthesis protein